MKSRFWFGVGRSDRVSRNGRNLRLAAIPILAALFCGYLEQYPRTFDYLEQRAYYERQAIRSEVLGSTVASNARDRIVVVRLSDHSVELGNTRKSGSVSEMNQAVGRDNQARIIKELTNAGARVIGFDFLFHKPQPEDGALAAAARASGRVVWAAGYTVVGKEQRFDLPVPQLLQASPFWGHAAIWAGPDGNYDRIAPVIHGRKKDVPAFSLELVRRDLGIEHQKILQIGNVWHCGSLSIPVEADGGFQVRFWGPVGATFDDIDYDEIYRRTSNFRARVQEGFFRNKIVLVGDTRPSTDDNSPDDFHRTPIGMMAGVDINAAAVATLLQADFVREASDAQNVSVMCLLMALTYVFAAMPRLRWAALLLALIPVAYYIINVAFFVYYDLSLDLSAPIAAVLLASVGLLIERGLTEEREKSRMRGLLRRYVSPQIAEYVTAHPERCILGGAGERVIATVLFSDIRDFTALSGALEPEDLVALLNEYFQAMSDIIFQHEGTIARFAGDAIMALFGVPVPHADHAHRAVATALDMQARMAALQADWRARGLPVFDIGVGINTGEMVAGNVGARQRMEFTVYGPPVNIASRVESLNKEFGTRILITEATYQLVADAVTARGPWSVQVKGIDEAIVTYEVLGPRLPESESAAADAGTPAPALQKETLT